MLGARGPRGGAGYPNFLEKSGKNFWRAACAADLRGLGTAGFGGIVVVRDVVGG